MPEKSENTPNNAAQNNVQSTQGQEGAGQTVPYAQFQKVSAKHKAAEDALASIVDELCADIPEDMRALVPNLPPTDKVKWLREARAKGLFAKTPPVTSPDSKRPVGKPGEDLSGLSPVAQMARGYKAGA